jgi:dipeptidyl aminopeptidase/acylaminoacyl peptidase
MSTLDYSVTSERPELGTHIEKKRSDSGWVRFLYEVDTSSGKGAQLEQGTQFTAQWVVDHRGHCVARGEWNPETATYTVLAKAGTKWRTIYTRQDGSGLQLYGVSNDGAAVVALGANSAGRRIGWLLPLNGEAMRPLYEDPDHDVIEIIRDSIDDRIVGLGLGGLEPGVHWLDTAAQTHAVTIARAFKDRHTEDWGHSRDGKRALVRVVDAARPAMYYLVDFDRHSADIVGDEYPPLSDATLGPVKAYSYAARDGTKIPAFLTLPAGATAKNLPLVVLPHGGPASNDDAFEFDYWAQFLASRGYAVLQPQFRRLAGHRQWGLLMQDDVTDGVKDAIAQGIADPQRICIVGASYGGYAALAGAAFTPELYKCAVSVSGVSNLPEMLGWIKGRTDKESDAVASWLESVGSAFDKNVIERSPALAVDRIRAPILLLHGVDDTVVPIAQSEDMARALAGHQKPFKFVKLPGEDHWLSRATTRLQVLREIETFLHDNL